MSMLLSNEQKEQLLEIFKQIELEKICSNECSDKWKEHNDALHSLIGNISNECFKNGFDSAVNTILTKNR